MLDSSCDTATVPPTTNTIYSRGSNVTQSSFHPKDVAAADLYGSCNAQSSFHPVAAAADLYGSCNGSTKSSIYSAGGRKQLQGVQVAAASTAYRASPSYPIEEAVRLLQIPADQ